MQAKQCYACKVQVPEEDRVAVISNLIVHWSCLEKENQVADYETMTQLRKGDAIDIKIIPRQDEKPNAITVRPEGGWWNSCFY